MDLFRKNLYERKSKGLYCDVTLVAAMDNQKIQAHRVVLYTASDYFRKLLAEDFKEKNATEIEIKDVRGDILSLLVDYCYTQQIAINATIAYDTMKAANLFGFTDVVQSCATVCEEAIDESNVLPLWVWAPLYGLARLQEAAQEFMELHFVEIVQEESFLYLDVDKLADYLAWDGILVNAEQDVYKAIVKWIEYDRSGRKQHFGGLMKALRMSRIDTNFLNGAIKQYADELEMNNVFKDAHEKKLMQRENLSDVARSPYFQYLYAAGQPAQIMRYSVLSNEWEDIARPDMRSCHINRIADCLYLMEMNGSLEGNQVMSLSLDTFELERERSSIVGRKDFCTVAHDQYVYAIGGSCLSSPRPLAIGSVERYDSETGKWGEISALKRQRSNAAAVVLDDRIYVIGGFGGSRLRSVERYNSHTKSWSMVGAMNVARSHHRCCTIKGAIYAVGGTGLLVSIEKYDKQLNNWTMLGVELDVPLSNFGIGALGEWIYIIGGSEVEDPDGDTFNCLQRINVSTGRKQKLSALQYELSHCVMTQ